MRPQHPRYQRPEGFVTRLKESIIRVIFLRLNFFFCGGGKHLSTLDFADSEVLLILISLLVDVLRRFFHRHLGNIRTAVTAHVAFFIFILRLFFSEKKNKKYFTPCYKPVVRRDHFQRTMPRFPLM